MSNLNPQGDMVLYNQTTFLDTREYQCNITKSTQFFEAQLVRLNLLCTTDFCLQYRIREL